MNSFRLIAGSGHCGSKWLATVLAAQPNVTAHHELRQHLYPGPWYEAVQRGPYHPVNGPYFDAIHERLKRGDVWDSNSWGVHEIPLVNKLQPIDEVIYLVRNPILQLHSIWTQSAVWRKWPEEHFIFDVWLRNAYEMEPRPPLYDERNRWGKLCELVRANIYGPEWLRRQGIDMVRVCKLEDLTELDRPLKWILPDLSPEQIRIWQQQDINRKVDGSREPDYLWSLWSDSQRRVFEKLCAAAMNVYGYEWPQPIVERDSVLCT